MKYTDLESFLNAYIKIQKACCKPSTIKNMRAAANLLLAFFGNKKDISEIILIDGENFVDHLKSKGYAPATISRAMQRTIAFFKFAQKSKVLVDNPFSGIKLMKITYPARMQFIDRTTFLKVLDHCPNTQWKLIVSLARVSGIRIPSELVGLTWECIHWRLGEAHYSYTRATGSACTCSRAATVTSIGCACSTRCGSSSGTT